MNVITKNILIPTINDVKEFVTIVGKFACNATLKSGRYIIDAKSIMGVFSLDITKPIQLDLEVGDNGKDDRGIMVTAIEKFIVD